MKQCTRMGGLKRPRIKGNFSLALALFGCALSAAPLLGADVPVSEATRAATNSTALPLSELILYSSGVGYFERQGTVEGSANIGLQFRVEDINDLLKSMVVQDLDGGHVTTVTYASRDPISKILKSFSVDLTANPSLGSLLQQVRGERVQVTWPNEVEGIILGVEKKQEPVKDDKVVEKEYLNLLTDDGFQSIPLAQVQKIKLLNERLNRELRQALQVLASSKDTDKKSVELRFEGTGQRRVSVAYIAQTPVWKTSYRLVLDDEEKPFLQGWAIVENTTDEDWKDVRLSLVSGRPVSFTMDLYQPLYTKRPVVQPELYLSLQPQKYGEALESRSEAAVAQMPQLMEPQLANRSRVQAESLASKSRSFARDTAAAPPGSAFGLANVQNLSIGDGLAQSVQAAAAGAEAGELFQYSIQSPVTLARQSSAMLPIVNHSLSGEKVSIYNSNVQAKHPLNGFRLKNDSGLHLMQGPITVFDDGTYAGDARIDDVAPGQERLISYALDLKMEVEPQGAAGAEELISAKIRKGTLIVTRRAAQERKYFIKNRDQKQRDLLVEHPFQSEWQLIEPGAATERTRDVYRFMVKVPANGTNTLVVREQRPISEQIFLSDIPSDFIAIYQRSNKVSDRVKEALEKVVGLRDQISETQRERNEREQRIAAITQEQARIRENMGKLSQNSDLYVRYVRKLNEQETEIEQFRTEIQDLQKRENQQYKELNEYLLNLDLE